MSVSSEIAEQDLATNGMIRGTPSLQGLHGTVPVPPAGAGFWRQWRAFVGPAVLISVGYMDPGNWGTDLKAGAIYRYGLLWVVALSSVMAIIVQVIAARLGVVTGKDLAQACRDFYPAWTRWPNWLSCEVAIGACDLAEVLGSAVAINMLFGIPIFWAVLITAFDVLLLLALQGLGMRLIEAFVLVLVATIGVCFAIELFVLPGTSPNFAEMGGALTRPRLDGGDAGPGHRHHRGDGHAAQSLSAFGPGAVTARRHGRCLDPPGPALQYPGLGRWPCRWPS